MSRSDPETGTGNPSPALSRDAASMARQSARTPPVGRASRNGRGQRSQPKAHIDAVRPRGWCAPFGEIGAVFGKSVLSFKARNCPPSVAGGAVDTSPRRCQLDCIGICRIRGTTLALMGEMPTRDRSAPAFERPRGRLYPRVESAILAGGTSLQRISPAPRHNRQGDIAGAFLRRRDRIARSLRVVHYWAAVNRFFTAWLWRLLRNARVSGPTYRNPVDAGVSH